MALEVGRERGVDLRVGSGRQVRHPIRVDTLGHVAVEPRSELMPAARAELVRWIRDLATLGALLGDGSVWVRDDLQPALVYTLPANLVHVFR